MQLLLALMMATVAPPGAASPPPSPNGMRFVQAGEYKPLYGGKEGEQRAVQVEAFHIDAFPVTNEEFLKFVEMHPQWRRSQVPRIFADANYLTLWKGDNSFGSEPARAPVVHVSWFAADAYCRALNKRLPSLDEWEYVAMADEKHKDARERPEFTERILGWYATPKTFRNLVASTFKNAWGVWDLHGLVWEWTYDFNSVMIAGESRNNSDKDSGLFCGGASINASDLTNYAAFMRYAFRGSLKASYTVRNLGFRCAQ